MIGVVEMGPFFFGLYYDTIVGERSRLILRLKKTADPRCVCDLYLHGEIQRMVSKLLKCVASDGGEWENNILLDFLSRSSLQYASISMSGANRI